MKIKKLMMDNFGKFSKFSIEFGNEITHLVGVNGSGKTTIGLTALWACIKGVAEKAASGNIIGDRFHFIGPNKKSADLEVILIEEKTGETITCKNHMTKDTNQISFISSVGRKLNSDWINSLFNFVFMSAKSFCQLSGKAQVLALGIDVSKFDFELKNLKSEYTLINRDLKSFGNLVEPEKVEPVDVSVLNVEKDRIRKQLNDLYLANVEHNKKLREKYNQDVQTERENNIDFNQAQDIKMLNISNAESAHEKLIEIGYKGDEVAWFIKLLPIPEPQKTSITTPEPTYITERPDDSELIEIDAKISNAVTINSKAAIYAEYLKNKAKKDAKEKELSDNKYAQEAKEKERLDYITSFKFGFAGVSVNDEGELLLNGRPIKEPYYSKGELEMIVAKIASSINSEWKTRFIDDFEALDPDNQEKILKDLIDAGYQVITAEVGKTSNKDGSVILRECKIVTDDEPETEQIQLF